MLQLDIPDEKVDEELLNGGMTGGHCEGVLSVLVDFPILICD